jgi:transcriptional regulator with XRE-family HTH domain
MPRIGTKLHELRRRRSLSVREVAKRSGVSHSAISLIERDRMSPSVDTLTAILDALGTTLTGFFLDLQSNLPASPFYGTSDRSCGYDFLPHDRRQPSQQAAPDAA